MAQAVEASTHRPGAMYAKDIDTLTVEKVRKLGMLVFTPTPSSFLLLCMERDFQLIARVCSVLDVIDHENITEARWQKLK
jgi:hypothetical protein